MKFSHPYKSRRILVLSVLAAFWLACAAPLLAPDESDVVRARITWENATLQELSAGHTLYSQKCGSCHFLYRPNQFSADQWAVAMEDMAKEANLSPQENELITRYILTMREKSL